MARVDASLIVANVVNRNPSWDLAFVFLIGIAVSKQKIVVLLDHSIPTAVYSAGPIPAGFGTLNFRPEPILKGLAITHVAQSS